MKQDKNFLNNNRIFIVQGARALLPAHHKRTGQTKPAD